MPQLVKGGKYVFGWSYVGDEGKISLPPEAWIEYNYQLYDEVILISGSKTSGGFSIIKIDKLLESSLSRIISESQGNLPKNEIFQNGNRNLFVSTFEEECAINLKPNVLNKFGIGLNTKLLAARGSGLGLGFIAKGPIYQEAENHPELELFT